MARTNHPYSPSTVPSVDGTGCLWRECLADGTYSLRTCQRPERQHPTQPAKNDSFVQAVIDFEVATDEYNAAAFHQSQVDHGGPWNSANIREFHAMQAANAVLSRASAAFAEEAMDVFFVDPTPEQRVKTLSMLVNGTF